MDHYAALEADPTESETALRRRYLALARRYHPDQLVSASDDVLEEAEERMRSVNEAWAVLGDKARRLRYDQTLFESNIEAAKEDWKPFDDSYVPEYEEPVVPGRARPPQWMAMTPPLLVGSGVVVGFIGGILGGAVLALGIAMIVLGAISFVLAPVAVMVMSARSEKR